MAEKSYADGLFARVRGSSKWLGPVEIKRQSLVPVENATSYHYRKMVNRRLISENLGSDLNEVLVKWRNLDADSERIRRGKAPINESAPKPEPAPEDISIKNAADQYLRDQANRVQSWRDGSTGGIAPSTLDVIRNAVETFLDACGDCGAYDISELKNPIRGRQIMLHVLKFMQENTKRRKGKAAHTDGKKLVFIGQLLAVNGIKMAQEKRVRYQGDPGLLRSYEVPRAKKPKVSDVVFYTPDDLKAMWVGAGKVEATRNGVQRATWGGQDIQDLLAVLTLTGMRDEEVQHLLWSDIIWANGDGLPKFRVKDKPRYDWKPKNGERTVQPVEYFAVELREILKARKVRKTVKDDNSLVFHTTVGTPDQNFADQIRKTIDNAMAAGHEFNRPEAHQHNIIHNFRRTFATVLNSCYGLSAPTVQDRIGDASLETVQHYLGKVDDPTAMRKAFEALPFKSAEAAEKRGK